MVVVVVGVQGAEVAGGRGGVGFVAPGRGQG